MALRIDTMFQEEQTTLEGSSAPHGYILKKKHLVTLIKCLSEQKIARVVRRHQVAICAIIVPFEPSSASPTSFRLSQALITGW